MKLYELHEIM